MRCTIQRHCDPALVRKLWDAINYVRQQKQIANIDRIQRFLLREHDMRAAEVKEHVEHAVEDTLIDQYTAVGFKGSKVGQEQAGYRMPDGVDVEKGDHDWYCFTCQKPGEVLCCSECWRVYHTTCTESDWSGSKFICGVCKQMRHRQKIKRKELNKLLGYTVNRLKEKVNTSKELHALFKQEEEGRWRQFIYQEMDLNTMETKCMQKKYKYLEQFQADAQIIYHNVLLCYGEYGSMADIVKIMIRDCKYDIDEIRLCKDCYLYSNAKPKDWFCKPCHPPHKLVFAKQKGFSYWPAKVIRDTKDGFDVRFFGGWHQRAVIQKTSVKDIDINMKTLNIKKTGGFTRAMEELKRHQELLETVTPEGSAADTETDNASGEDEDEAPVKKEVVKKKEKKPIIVKEQDADDEEFPPAAPVRKKPGRKKKSIVMEQDEDTPVRMKGKKRPCYMPDPEEEEAVETPVKPKSKKMRKSHTGTPKRKKSLEETDIDFTPSPRKKKLKEERDMDIISSSNVLDKSASTPEDANLVTSSEDNIHPSRIITTTDTGTQTSKKVAGRQPTKATQTDKEQPATSSSSGNCDCDQKYTKVFSDFKTRLEDDHKDAKDLALKELSERLQKDFENDKQQAVSRAIANMQREVERVRRQAEERSKEQYMGEMMKLAQKHKTEISVTKKKQWCYNCEEEAMYHCCWNTSYCSTKCQQEHWHREHKRMCRRKR